MNDDVYVIGFTGSREGMTELQEAEVSKILRSLISAQPGAIGLHGDCVGADADFNDLCSLVGVGTVCRPSTLTHMRAYTGATVIAPPEPPLTRNRKIVNQASIMLACPNSRKEVRRSGTWATIRLVRRRIKVLHIVYPCGFVATEGLD